MRIWSVVCALCETVGAFVLLEVVHKEKLIHVAEDGRVVPNAPEIRQGLKFECYQNTHRLLIEGPVPDALWSCSKIKILLLRL